MQRVEPAKLICIKMRTHVSKGVLALLSLSRRYFKSLEESLFFEVETGYVDQSVHKGHIM